MIFGIFATGTTFVGIFAIFVTGTTFVEIFAIFVTGTTSVEIIASVMESLSMMLLHLLEVWKWLLNFVGILANDVQVGGILASGIILQGHKQLM